MTGENKSEQFEWYEANDANSGEIPYDGTSIEVWHKELTRRQIEEPTDSSDGNLPVTGTEEIPGTDFMARYRTQQ